jgi:hypothetical protein
MERNKKIFTEEQKKTLLRLVLDDESFKAIEHKPSKINEAFNCNLANIIIQTQGEFLNVKTTIRIIRHTNYDYKLF